MRYLKPTQPKSKEFPNLHKFCKTYHIKSSFIKPAYGELIKIFEGFGEDAQKELWAMMLEDDNSIEKSVWVYDFADQHTFRNIYKLMINHSQQGLASLYCNKDHLSEWISQENDITVNCFDAFMLDLQHDPNQN